MHLDTPVARLNLITNTLEAPVLRTGYTDESTVSGGRNYMNITNGTRDLSKGVSVFVSGS